MRTAKGAITPQHFKLTVEQSDMESVMRECYEYEVMLRKREPNMDGSVLDYIRKVAHWITDPGTKPSLLLFGGIGNGKTTLARALRRSIAAIGATAKNSAEIVDNVERRHPLSSIRTPAIVSAQDIADGVLSDEKKSAVLLTSDIIIIDDLGCEPMSAKVFGTETTPMIDVLRYRYDNQKSTVITTNLDLAAIEGKYGARVLDRIIETYERIAFENKSYRK